jgi:hypothetical protein
MSAVSTNPKIDDLVRALRDQGWEVDKRTGRSYKATPPDAGRKVVFFDAPSESGPHGMIYVIRQLRHEGFVWPPPEREKKAAGDVVPIVLATPFAPVPNPHAQAVAPGAPEPVATPDAPSEPRTLVPRVDSAYLDLKDAKEFADLVAQDLREAKAVLLAAQERVARAEAQYAEAVEDLREKRMVFNKSFDAEDA